MMNVHLSLQNNICFSPVFNVDVGEALDLFYALYCWVYDLHHINIDFVLDLEKIAVCLNNGGNEVRRGTNRDTPLTPPPPKFL